MGKTVYVVFRSTLVEFFIEEQSAERASAANIVPTQYPNYQTWMNGRDAEVEEQCAATQNCPAFIKIICYVTNG
ncbi:Mobilization protein [Trichinella spiralis]|uniref:Mobilization protein n=1 Tax=Trichinella spiralis TaxID=6334 RepID=A0ABR3KL33_TRISP